MTRRLISRVSMDGLCRRSLSIRCGGSDDPDIVRLEPDLLIPVAPPAEEAWEDAAALEASDYMIDRAGAYYLGRIAAERFTLERSQRIIDFFKTSELDRLCGQLGGPTATEQLDAYRLGFERGRRLTGS